MSRKKYLAYKGTDWDTGPQLMAETSGKIYLLLYHKYMKILESAL